MRYYATDYDLHKQPQRILISSFKLENGRVITPLIIFVFFSALEAMPKIMEFHHNKGIDMLKIKCTLPSLANNCLQKSTNIKFCPFAEVDRELHNKKAGMWTFVPLLSLLEKRVFKHIIEHTIEAKRKFAIQLLVEIPANSTPLNVLRKATGFYTTC